MDTDQLAKMRRLEQQVDFLTNQNALRIIQHLAEHEAIEELVRTQTLMVEYLRTEVARKLEIQYPPMN